MSGAGVAYDGVVTQGWWLVRDGEDDRVPEEVGRSVVAGPFADRDEAEWAAVAQGAVAVRAVHGVAGDDGAVVPCPAPQERSWLTHLGRQLDRLGAEWDAVVSDDDALTTLVVEVASALVEAGLPLHDCTAGSDAAGEGGVCLTPDPSCSGVIVSWRQHDRMSIELSRGAAAEAAVQQVMNAAVAEVLAALGFPVEPFAGGTGHVVRAERRPG